MATKEELLQEANELGVEVPEGAKFTEITALIKEAKAAAKLEDITKQANELGVEVPEGATYEEIAKLVTVAKAKADVKDEIDADADAKANETEKAKSGGAVYVGCRILGGIKIVHEEAGEKKNILLRSANEKSISPDGVLNFAIKPHEYGLTILTAEEAAIVKAKIGGASYVRKGFVFFANSREDFEQVAAALTSHKTYYQTTGLEPLTLADIEKTVEVYKKEA